jgi:ubiquinone/menaquinone biosynthesis C-methylase UbiE
MERKQAAGIAALAGIAGAGYAAYRWRKAARAEVERLAAILGWTPGRVVADIGAGRGSMALAAARRVGPTGHVFATDVDARKLNSVRKKAEKQDLVNITIAQATQTDSKLPDDSFDAILLRGSYHHFTDPVSAGASLYRALRPGGMLAIVDFAPRWWLTLFSPVKDAPPDRGGHGIPRDLLVRELTAAGFEVQKTIPRWFRDVYCVVFRKPVPGYTRKDKVKPWPN